MDGPGSPQHREFISEAITPVEGSFDTASMATGEPGLPQRFRWRGTEYEVATVLERRKTTGPCQHGSGEQYVRKHWLRIETTDGMEMELYFDRQSRTKDAKQRWWLATITEKAGPRLAVSVERCQDITEKIRAARICVVGRLETVELVEIASGSLRTAGRFALRDK